MAMFNFCRNRTFTKHIAYLSHSLFASTRPKLTAVELGNVVRRACSVLLYTERNAKSHSNSQVVSDSVTSDGESEH